ncbi:MAG: aminotransferase class I/II-fold pyridoxal phosphate-dependent enzyme [Bacteroidales bacterium]
MKINEFKLERYFAEFEFTAKYLLSPSDCESMKVSELLALGDGECINLWQDLKLGYTESKGNPLLRKEISMVYKTMKPENIIVLAPEEGIFIVMNSILDHGDHVIVPEPCYQSLFEIAAAIGCEITRWPLNPDKGRWILETGFLKKNIRKNTKLVVLNFPHNPTGFIPEADVFRNILEICEMNGTYVLSDEMYRFLEFTPSLIHGSAADLSERCIALSGLSKSFGLPGLRIGWLATRDKHLLKQFESMKDYTTICNSAPAEILSIIALRNKARITGNNLDLIKGNLKSARSFFVRHEDMFTWYEPQGGSVAFPGLVRRIPADLFCRKLIRQKSILLLPGNVFDYRGNHFRIGFGRNDFSLILGELESGLEELDIF